MELQKLIDNHPNDYIDVFKKNKLYVRKYTMLGLLLVKTYAKNEYDYLNNKWMLYCRGAIINIRTKRVICVPPIKSVKKEEIDISDYGDEYIYEPLIDGTMINLFYHNDEWMLSTRSNIGGKNSWDGKVPFCTLFNSVNGSEWYNKLKKDHSYSFVLQHYKNRIVTPVVKNTIYLVEMYKYIEDRIIQLKTNEMETIDGIHNNIQMKPGDIKYYIGDNIPYTIKGYTIKGDGGRIKWINPKYEYVSELKSNFNNKFLSYIELRQEWKLSEYLKYFPEERYIFNIYRDRYSEIKNKLYNSYVDLNIKKSITIREVPYPLKPLIYEIHGYYKKEKHKINMAYINEYMQNIPGKKVLFIYNYFFKGSE